MREHWPVKAQTLVSAGSRLIWTLVSRPENVRRDESRRGRHECPRHESGSCIFLDEPEYAGDLRRSESRPGRHQSWHECPGCSPCADLSACRAAPPRTRLREKPSAHHLDECSIGVMRHPGLNHRATGTWRRPPFPRTAKVRGPGHAATCHSTPRKPASPTRPQQ